jgi:hypothetical protein
MKFSIITPTTGHSLFQNLLLSVSNQIMNDDIQIEHIIVIDGPDFKERTESILNSVPINENQERFIIQMPYNTGSGGFLGHKIYSAITQLVNGDYVIYLDNDNWLENDHIINYYNAIKTHNYDWVYCLRKICDLQGNYICNDDCESLGYLSNAFYHRGVFFIDTNCTCVKRDIAFKFCHVWNSVGTDNEDNADRVYSKTLMSLYPNYECTFAYSVNYCVDNRAKSVKKDLFLIGNQVTMQKYGSIPWTKKQLFLSHFDFENTEKVIERIYQREKECIAFNQWNLNILDQMYDHFCISAYNPFIPSNKKILFHICHFNLLPERVLERNDVEKILYTIEGPNIRHQDQWNIELLFSKFSHIISYWKPFIEIANLNSSKNATFFPFIHRYDFTNTGDLECIKINNNREKKICIILEKRDFSEKYQINGTELKALDYLRWEYCRELGKRIDCYGSSWEPFKDIINYKATQNRFLDKERIIDFMCNYTFVLIIENCNADGYVSEKIYDALSAGCIPLYYGNNNLDVNIPKDCYIDLKNIEPKALPNSLDTITDFMLETFQKNMNSKRTQILENVSVNKYNELLKTFLI